MIHGFTRRLNLFTWWSSRTDDLDEEWIDSWFDSFKREYVFDMIRNGLNQLIETWLDSLVKKKLLKLSF